MTFPDYFARIEQQGYADVSLSGVDITSQSTQTARNSPAHEGVQWTRKPASYMTTIIANKQAWSVLFFFLLQWWSPLYIS